MIRNVPRARLLRMTAAIAVLVVVPVVGYLVAGYRRLASAREAVARDAAAERATDRARQHPCLHGKGDANRDFLTIADPAIGAVEQSPVDVNEWSRIADEMRAGGPPSAATLALVAEHRAGVDALLAAARARGVDRRIDYLSVGGPFSVAAARRAGLLVLADARARAMRGEPDAAVERVLAVVRLGLFAMIGDGLCARAGAWIVDDACTTLERLLAAGGLTRDAMTAAARGLLLAEEGLPDLADAARRDFLLQRARLVRIQDGDGRSIARPGAARTAAACAALNAALAEVERAANIEATRERRAALAEVETGLLSRDADLRGALTPRIADVDAALCVARATLRVARAGVDHASARARGAVPPPLPPDPCDAPAHLLSEQLPDGGVRIWSVGANGRDDRGQRNDLGGRDDIAFEAR